MIITLQRPSNPILFILDFSYVCSYRLIMFIPNLKFLKIKNLPFTDQIMTDVSLLHTTFKYIYIYILFYEILQIFHCINNAKQNRIGVAGNMPTSKKVDVVSFCLSVFMMYAHAVALGTIKYCVVSLYFRFSFVSYCMINFDSSNLFRQ